MATGDLESRVAPSCAEPQLMEQYRAFGRECRKIISELIRYGTYQNLRSNTRRGKPVVEGDGKARVNILGRPYMQHTGTRSLNAGNSEIVFVVQAPLTCPYDYRKGFALHGKQGWLRIAVGNDLANDTMWDRTNIDMTAIMLGEAKMRLMNLSTCLSLGDYGGFVEEVVRIADSAVNKLITEYRSTRLA